MKVVINRCYGGFSLSAKALELLVPKDNWFWCADENRADPRLVKVVEDLGEAANGAMAVLEIVEIPDDVSWEIAEYDGMEAVCEKHRTWS